MIGAGHGGDGRNIGLGMPGILIGFGRLAGTDGLRQEVYSES